jgi:hypothetical protein
LVPLAGKASGTTSAQTGLRKALILVIQRRTTQGGILRRPFNRRMDSASSRSLPPNSDTTGESAITEKERRRNAQALHATLKRELNEAQKLTLGELERFGWELKFVRRPLFQAPIPIVFDGDRKTFAVLEADGTLNENPGFVIRQ